MAVRGDYLTDGVVIVKVMNIWAAGTYPGTNFSAYPLNTKILYECRQVGMNARTPTEGSSVTITDPIIAVTVILNLPKLIYTEDQINNDFSIAPNSFQLKQIWG